MKYIRNNLEANFMKSNPQGMQEPMMEDAVRQSN